MFSSKLRYGLLLLIGVLLIIGAAVGIATTEPTQTARPAGVDAGWQIRFQDEFDGSAIESSKWTTCFHFGEVVDGALRCILGEKPYGVHEPDNVEIAAGNARISLDREARSAFGKSFDYTFGMLSSLDAFTFQYGYAEIRAKVPAGKGVWPAFWLLPADKSWPPEIDIVEWLGREPDTIHGTLHFSDFNTAQKSSGGTFKGPDFSLEYHTFGLKWTAEELIWFVDGVEYFRVREHVPAQKMYIVLSHGAGTPDSWGGPIGEDVTFPNTFEVDYVRVYGP